jgi:hypothetical protein
VVAGNSEPERQVPWLGLLIPNAAVFILNLNSPGSFSLALGTEAIARTRGAAHDSARRERHLFTLELLLELETTRKAVTGLRLGLGSNCQTATSRGEGKANPVLHCPYVHSTLAFENEQIN